MEKGREESVVKTGDLPQFGLSAMLWTTFVVALAFGYLRQFNLPSLYISAGVVMIASVLFGALIGWPFHRIGSAAYWAVVIASAAFLSVSGDLRTSTMFRIAWSTTGVLSGAICGAVAPGKVFRRVLLGAVAGGGGMLVCSIAMPRDLEWLFDLLCAPLVGGLVGVLIELVLWLERQRYSPRYITASWLLLAVIIGNLLVPFVLARY
ncbi:MAG: hypothetical protein H6822_05535 [Planctomycetaceae bacterium]|nr:hypothetical protein [Planctomycetales bacterium]MCB9921620.1 hypothetical protein [Planctomycetaceae bacterium]